MTNQVIVHVSEDTAKTVVYGIGGYAIGSLIGIVILIVLVKTKVFDKVLDWTFK